tara:strand:+ start:531 stop:1388 length:858 start_codon:yes stop_codon:yes gene_type:complete
MTKNKPQTITVVGLGHIGGSLSLSLKKAFKQKLKLIGVDPNKRTLSQAKTTNKFSTLSVQLKKSEAEISDIIFLCVSIKKIPKILQQLSQMKLKKGAIISDVASTKKESLKWAKKYLPKTVNFVGGHPIAGTEKSGFASADTELFKNKTFVISGSSGSIASVRKIASIWRILGSTIASLSPEEHDKIFSSLSHMPHVLTFGLQKIAKSKISKKKIEQFGGTSYKDYSRISTSNLTLWAEIFLSNEKNIVSDIHRFTKYLSSLERAIKSKNNKKLVSIIQSKSRKP